MIEDATVIYRISRAPERRIFYIDVGNLPKLKAEQYLRDIMVKYKNKLVYDANTGEVRDDRKFMSMMEDFWLPRREGGKGTEITTLPGGQNLGELEDVKYFEKKLYKSLNVPISRLEPNQGFSIGRVAEVTRDELKFNKFIDRLRNKFSEVFDHALRVQLVLKGICTAEEWDLFKEHIYYDFIKDNNFSELKEAELMTNRLTLLGSIDPFVGSYYSRAWVQREVLRLNDDAIKLMDGEIEEEKALGMGLPTQVTTQVAQQQMMGQVDGENQLAAAKAMNDAGLDKAEASQETAAKNPKTKETKPAEKKESKPTSKKPASKSKGDLTLEVDNTFSRLKRLL